MKDTSVILGLDVGTTCCKCMAFDAGLNLLAESSVEYGLVHGGDGMVEQDPEVWWSAALETIRRTAALSLKHGPVRGIGVSSQGISFVPVDLEGNHLMNAMTWLDMRSAEQCDDLKRSIDEKDIYKKTGKRINPAYSLPKMIWLRDNLPGIYMETFKFLTAHDYIIGRLCKNFVTEDSLAAGTMAYDINEKRWDPEILGYAGISVEKLPDIKRSGSGAGYLDKEVAANTGLFEDVLVSTGGQDQKCAALGAGLSYDCITVSIGTSCAITALFDAPVFPSDMSLPCFPYIDGKSWVLEGFGSTAGVSLKWFRDNAGKHSYREIDEGIRALYDSDRIPDNVLFFPYLGGTASPEWYDAKGGGFLGITLDTGNFSMAAAVLEGVAFTIKSNILKMESLGRTFREISIFGGGAKSDVWLKIIADITGKQVRKAYLEESACLGAAMMCIKAMGVSEIKLPSKERLIKPNPDKTVLYEKKYQRYRELADRIYGGEL